MVDALTTTWPARRVQTTEIGGRDLQAWTTEIYICTNILFRTACRSHTVIPPCRHIVGKPSGRQREV